MAIANGGLTRGSGLRNHGMTHGHAARLCPVGPKGPKLGVTMVAMVRWSRAGAPGNRKRQFQKFQKPQTPKSPSPRGAEQINPAILW